MSADLMKRAYEAVKAQARADLKSDSTRQSILHLALTSLAFLLQECQEISLTSRVRGKQYFSYRRDNVVARPVNSEFFLPDPKAIRVLWENWNQTHISHDQFAQLLYTIALAPCLAMEILDRQNKKGPATFFEHYIGHLIGHTAGSNPIRRLDLPVHGRRVRMTMDLLFDLRHASTKLHVPVKMSTRERVVQAWSHQRLLNSAYGDGAYRGIMVFFAETKMDSRTLEVVEICVPDQWLAYQALLAKMERIYYFDIPVRYRDLTSTYPHVISIKEITSLFSEAGDLLGPTNRLRQTLF